MEESAQFISTSTTSLDEKIVDSLKSDFNSIDIAVAFIFKPGLELLKVGIGRAHGTKKGGGNARKRFYLTIAEFDQLTLEDAEDLLAS